MVRILGSTFGKQILEIHRNLEPVDLSETHAVTAKKASIMARGEKFGHSKMNNEQQSVRFFQQPRDR